MNLRLRSLIILSGISPLAGTSDAAQPPDSVQSDGKQNTAMGYQALLNLGGTCSGYQCSYNTAAGFRALLGNTTGNSNTAFGTQALLTNTTGLYNTAVGSFALAKNNPVGTTVIQNANGNTGIGAGSLHSNTNGYYNTAVGAYSLAHSTTATNNTATGAYAMSHAYGSFNTATGSYALHGPKPPSGTPGENTGSSNTVSGYKSMLFNTSGSTNSTSGALALYSNTTGSNNTAIGSSALYSNTTGKGNAAQGANALYSNTTGIRNLGIGSNALFNSDGSYNIALGFDAGYNVTTGSNNIEIGTLGAAGDNNTIQIGVQGTQTSTTIAGISGTVVIGSPVSVSSTGQLGVTGSSERFKTDIASMPDPEKLAQLRPVTFKYKIDPKGILQYGLIAEEVDKVYPELVIRDNAGKIMGVHYEELAPILLKEAQELKIALKTQATMISTQAQRYDALSARNDAQAAEIRDLKKLVVDMQADLVKLHAQDPLVARR
jgi:hypothetical protein